MLAAVTDSGHIVGATINLAVLTIGAGVLALPAAFSVCGYGTALIVIAVVGYYTAVSVRYLAVAIEALEMHSYEEIARTLLGSVYESIARWMLILYSFGATIGYLVVISDLLDPLRIIIVQAHPSLDLHLNRASSLLLFWFFVILPVSLVKRVSALRFSSLLGILAATYVSLLLVYRYFAPLDPPPLPITLAPSSSSSAASSFSNSNDVLNATVRVGIAAVAAQASHPAAFIPGMQIFLGIAVVTYSFDCQPLVFQLYANLSKPSVSRMSQVGFGGAATAGVIFFMIGLFGYLDFGYEVKENVLQSFSPERDVLAAIAYLFYSAPIVMSFALTLFPCRDAIFLKFHGVAAATAATDDVSATLFNVWTFVLSISAVMCAVFAPGILSVVGVLGAMCSSTLCLTYPALFVFMLHRMKMKRVTSNWAWVDIFGMMILGVVGGFFGTIVALSHFVRNVT